MMKRKSVLSLDGGGAKGRITARILMNIERDFGSIYDKFDAFAGTSIGGVIALALACEMKASDIYNLFSQENLNKIFHKGFENYLPLTSKYSGVGKTEFLKGLFGVKKIGDLKKAVYIPAYNINRGQKIFGQGYEELSVIADATTAAPTYFPSITYNAETYVDGGLVTNNPSMILLSQEIYEGSEIKDIKLMSVGTGKKMNRYFYKDEDWDAVEWLKNGLIDDIIDGNEETVVTQCTNILKDNFMRVNPWLVNVSTSLDDITEDNLLAMDKTADEYYELNKEKIKDFLTN